MLSGISARECGYSSIPNCNVFKFGGKSILNGYE